ncbi:SsrA-binding protein SmpB [Peptoniphilus catoniae]|uniref:SsrA-binding protein SmpB n=1 Tax=Peptoniphilus catoniae TaxID=1660341 RepID=UPI0010FEB9FB|nr:SsrA-binding protein SmpB [Peptoniphilus catoniae]
MAKGKDNSLATNRKARHDYFIESTIEAGIELRGTEVKSLRQGKANISDAYAEIVGGEVYVENMHISPYKQGNIFNMDPLRKRKLLLHKSEIRKLDRDLTLKGYTLIPLRLYLNRGRVKVELALARGKKLYDKRQSLAQKDANRKIEQAMKERYI